MAAIGNARTERFEITGLDANAAQRAVDIEHQNVLGVIGQNVFDVSCAKFPITELLSLPQTTDSSSRGLQNCSNATTQVAAGLLGELFGLPERNGILIGSGSQAERQAHLQAARPLKGVTIAPGAIMSALVSPVCTLLADYGAARPGVRAITGW